jgi:hypothetical protein
MCSRTGAACPATAPARSNNNRASSQLIDSPKRVGYIHIRGGSCPLTDMATERRGNFYGHSSLSTARAGAPSENPRQATPRILA